MITKLDSLNLVRRLIISQVSNIDDPTQISSSQMLYELGIDSLATVNLMVALAEATDADLENFVDDDVPTSVQDLCNLATKFSKSADHVSISSEG